ncbi:CDP-glycerol glycerophosphotransferase family protein [Brevibacterium sp. RIT 803]|uniref:CDP-glycerol glycerophosphotransferase family protein n=1 Tax=Brevibacterium sp. RIT 803 TaxID=2810210 RepID=UPI00194ED3E2|nr:CDP-glycerol glycerophosphotransferase family protein [Brevibacterium sp. RIT 803]MBM6589173.1 CDP-glycerol glycerophosphotransferase family protein [Brevibacterium sp. RIT 803]
MTNLPEDLSHQAVKGANFAQSAAKLGARKFRDRIHESRLSADFYPQDTDEFIAAAYFGVGMDSVYQLEQWLWPFEQLEAELKRSGHGDQPFGIIVRSPMVAKHLRNVTQLPVRFSRLTKGLDSFMMSSSLRTVFYVNQSTPNFQALRYPNPAHVHLSHGESEKISMISNQLKAYDYVFTAGEAARVRIEHSLVGLDSKRLRDVGRPQLDRPRETAQAWREFDAEAPAGMTVFYAPTWEGDSPSMAYGTLADNGAMLVSNMLAAGFRVIFRPHPRTGVRDRNFKKALDEVCAIIDSDPRGLLDVTSDVSWQFDVADRALVEMSSVAFDWLSTRKPLVMIKPCQSDSMVLPGGLFERTPTIGKGSEDSLIDLLSNQTDSVETAAQLCEYYLGSTVQGAQIDRFYSATKQVIAERNRNLTGRP